MQEIPGRPEFEAEPTVIKGNDVAGGLNGKGPQGEGFSSTVRQVLGKL